ncbi:MAG TPA: ROK family protein [Candidatus Saccharimonadales bacterium]|nr:ROK family protein [Candidatus Saccharimonadales bacterium]
MKALAIDLGGTHASFALVEDETLVHTEAFPTDRAKGLRPLLPHFTEALQRVLAKTGTSVRDCIGIALGFAGLVDTRTGFVMSTNAKYDDALSVDLPAWCREAFGIPFRIENDARMALLGETYCGAARGVTDAVMITLGTGVGGAALIEGKLLRGKHMQAGCLGGHIPVLFSGRKCTCGNIGCAEAEASGWALPLILKEWPEIRTSALANYPEVGFKELFEEAGRGDSIALAIRNRCLNVWAADAVGLVHMYDPEVIVIGGGVMKSADAIIPYVQEYVANHAWTPWGKVQVRAAELGNHAGLFGAIPLLTERN